MTWTDDEIKRAEAAVLEWQGTPHMQRRQIKGRGVDCVHFVLAILQEAGLVPSCRLPQYPQHLGGGADRNTLPDIVRQIIHVDSIDPEAWEPQTGDIVIFRAVRRSNHCGIVARASVWHVATTKPVCAQSIRAATRRMQEALRLRERGLVRTDPEQIKIL